MRFNPWKRPSYERAAKIKTVRRRESDHSMRIDLLFYKNAILRFMTIESPRLRRTLGMARRTQLSSVARPVNIDEVEINSRKELQSLGRVRTTHITRAATDAASNVTPKSTVESQPVNSTRVKRGREETIPVTGVLHEFGVAKRELRGESFEHFFVAVATDSLNGEIKRLWGIDLERALKESRAQVGDH